MDIEALLRISHMLHYIATGLYAILNNKGETSYPYNEAVQSGLNGLAALSLEKGIESPSTPYDLMQWCQRPLKEWGLFSEESPWAIEDAILETDSLCLSDLGNELVILSKDLSQQLEQELMKDVLMECRIKEDQRGYVEFRKFLIEHPYLTQKEQESIIFHLDQESPLKHLVNAYESLSPATYCNEKNEAMACGYCGWIIEESRSGQLSCINEHCKRATKDFTVIWPIQNEAVHTLQRLKRGLMRYIAYPGLHELRLYNELKKYRSLQVELWPEIDTYDLRLTFNDGEVWVIDVKDWKSPYLLAMHSHLFPKEYHYAFFVIPDYRKSQDRRYLNSFENYWKGYRAEKDDYERVEFRTYSSFIKRVKEKEQFISQT